MNVYRIELRCTELRLNEVLEMLDNGEILYQSVEEKKEGKFYLIGEQN